MLDSGGYIKKPMIVLEINLCSLWMVKIGFSSPINMTPYNFLTILVSTNFIDDFVHGWQYQT